MICPKTNNEHGPAVRIRLLGWLVVLPALLLVWEAGARYANQPWIFPTATAVFGRLLHPNADLYSSGSLLWNTFVSMIRVLIGFSIAALTGIGLGLLMGTVRTLRLLVEPLIELLRPLCPIAWIPFAIAAFKLTTLPQLFGMSYTRTVFDQVQVGMLFVLFWGGFFPVVINTLDGVCGVRRDFVRLAWTLGAGKRQRFFHVYLPAAMPMILTGLRQGIGTCWFVIIAAEMLPGADSGIGYLLMYASDQCGMDVVVAAMIVIAAIGAGLNAILLFSFSRFTRWYGKEA